MENKMTVDRIIESNHKSLTKSEKIVADYVLNNIDEAYIKTLHELSEICHVGEATIMRFIKKIGYANLAEFKVGIAATLIHRENKQEDDDPLKEFMNDVHELTSQTLHALNRDDLNKAVNYIEDAKHLIIIGNGTSGYVAEAIAYRFMRAGRDCECVTDVHYAEIRSALVKEGDVIVAISYSGDNIDIISAAQRAKECGAKLITLTSYRTTRLQAMADVALFNSPDSMEHRLYGAGMRGIINQEFLAELLYITYKERHYDEVMSYQKMTAVSTSQHHEYIKD